MPGLPRVLQKTVLLPAPVPFRNGAFSCGKGNQPEGPHVCKRKTCKMSGRFCNRSGTKQGRDHSAATGKTTARKRRLRIPIQQCQREPAFVSSNPCAPVRFARVDGPQRTALTHRRQMGSHPCDALVAVHRQLTTGDRRMEGKRAHFSRLVDGWT